MGFFDGLFGTLNNLNPLQQASSMAKFVVGALLLLVVFFMIWVVVISKDGMKATPSAADRVFGVVTTKAHA